MKFRKRTRDVRRRAALAALLLPSLHAAHGQAADTSASPATTELERVTVTAEKRAVDLQKAPVAVTAISGATLDRSNITDLAGLNGTVPGLSIAKSAGFERIVTIRGIGNETPENPSIAQPGVSLHIDGVYIANAISLDQSLFDVDRIEVLRGPQGTLFGQSSTGGTISLVTRQPVLGEFSGGGDVSLGNYRLGRVRAELNVPVGETVAVRGSVQRYRHAGFGNNEALGDYGVDDADDASGKLAVLFRPSSTFSATLTAQGYHADQHGAEQKSIVDPNADPRTIAQDFPSKFKMRSNLYHANLEWTLPAFTLKSITAYQTLRHSQQIDGDRLTQAQLRLPDNSQPYAYDAVAGWNTTLNNLTQEFDLASRPGGAVDWLVGAFAMRQTSRENIVEFSGNETNPVLTAAPDIETNPPANLKFGSDTPVRRILGALFFQTTWHATERLRLTAGARYNRDVLHADLGTYAGANFGGPTPLAVNPQSIAGNKPTGKLAIDYDLTPDNLVYASLSRGYKPGGLNNNQNAVLVGHTFEPETVNAIEVGSKNRFADGKVRLNLAAYRYDYRNQQYLEVDPVPFNYGTANIPKTAIWGAEAEGSWLTAGGRLRFDANLAVQNGRFVGDYRALDQTTQAQVYATTPACGFGGQYYNPACWAAAAAAAKNLNGQRPAKLPSLQGSVDANYTFDLAQGTLLARAELVYRGHFDYRVFDDSTLDRVPSYTIVNLHLRYAPVAGRWSLAVTGTNLANRAGVNARFTDPYGQGATSQEFIPPRQVVVTAGYAF